MNCYDKNDQQFLASVLAEETDLRLLINSRKELGRIVRKEDYSEITSGCLEDVFKRAEGILRENLGSFWETFYDRA